MKEFLTLIKYFQGRSLKVVIGAAIGAIFLGKAQTALANVVINEVFANPVNEADEFVELYNLSDQAIEITGYKILDLVKTYTIPEATISAKGFFSLKKSNTGIALNNSGDEKVTLKDIADAELDSFSYEGSVEGKSYSRIGDGDDNWVAETEPSEAGANQAPPSPSPTPSPSPSPTPSPSPSPTPSPLASPSPTPSPLASPSPSSSPTRLKLEGLGSGEVMGASESGEKVELDEKKDSNYLISRWLIGLGLAMVIGVGVVFWRQGLYNQGIDEK